MALKNPVEPERLQKEKTMYEDDIAKRFMDKHMDIDFRKGNEISEEAKVAQELLTQPGTMQEWTHQKEQRNKKITPEAKVSHEHDERWGLTVVAPDTQQMDEELSTIKQAYQKVKFSKTKRCFCDKYSLMHSSCTCGKQKRVNEATLELFKVLDNL